MSEPEGTRRTIPTDDLCVDMGCEVVISAADFWTPVSIPSVAGDAAPVAVATVRDALGDCDWKDLVQWSARESDAFPPLIARSTDVVDGNVGEGSAMTLDSGFSSSSLLAPAAFADDDPEELGWCGVCDTRDRIDRSGVWPKWEDLNDLAELVPAADAVDDPIRGDDVSAVPDSEEGLVFAAGPKLGDPESGDARCEVVGPPSSAAAIPGLLAIATPAPSATANAPILPINRP